MLSLQNFSASSSVCWKFRHNALSFVTGSTTASSAATRQQLFNNDKGEKLMMRLIFPSLLLQLLLTVAGFPHLDVVFPHLDVVDRWLATPKRARIAH